MMTRVEPSTDILLQCILGNNIKKPKATIIFKHANLNLKLSRCCSFQWIFSYSSQCHRVTCAQVRGAMYFLMPTSPSYSLQSVPKWSTRTPIGLTSRQWSPVIRSLLYATSWFATRSLISSLPTGGILCRRMFIRKRKNPCDLNRSLSDLKPPHNLRRSLDI